MPPRIDTLLRGPHVRWPRPLDAASEWWSRRRPRVRALLVVALTVGALSAGEAHLRAVQARWGGPAVEVVVAARHLHVGDELRDLRTVAVPLPLVPPQALASADARGVLALAAPEGTVLTRAHVDARGPAAGLAPGMRAVPLPTDAGWGITQGGWVDVWTLGGAGEPSTLVARARPVLQILEDGAGLTSLVGLSSDEVEAVTAGLAVGRVLLTHAPAPARR